MKFSEQLSPLVAILGTQRAAEICGVSRRSMQLWLQDGGNPNLATQVGAIILIKKARRRVGTKGG